MEKEKIMSEYVLYSSRAGEHRYKISKLLKEIEFHEKKEKECFENMDKISKEYNEFLSKQDKEKNDQKVVELKNGEENESI